MFFTISEKENVVGKRWYEVAKAADANVKANANPEASVRASGADVLLFINKML